MKCKAISLLTIGCCRCILGLVIINVKVTYASVIRNRTHLREWKRVSNQSTRMQVTKIKHIDIIKSYSKRTARINLKMHWKEQN